jgi:hypothetical protein
LLCSFSKTDTDPFAFKRPFCSGYAAGLFIHDVE